MSRGDWLLIQELLDRGEDEFVDRLRQFDDADVLAGFAERWYANQAPRSRELLLAYLDRPLNAYRHEPLVKRLFKLAEKAGDDELMARFLVVFDRSLRRIRGERSRTVTRTAADAAEARRIEETLKAEGAEFTHVYRGKLVGEPIRIVGWVKEPCLTVPPWSKMPRVGTGLSVVARRRLERHRLFSAPTRQYLRRRAWRYFRALGKADPDRYRQSIMKALVAYEEADVYDADDPTDGLALLDNWGLIHALFHHSEVLDSRPRGWVPREGRSLVELRPAPAFPEAWAGQVRSLLELVGSARSRPVRRWAMLMLGDDPEGAVGRDIESIILLLDHGDAEVVGWAANLLERSGAAGSLEPSRWLELTRRAGPEALPILARLMRDHLEPARLSVAEAAELASNHSLPLAQFGLEVLESRAIDAGRAPALLPLIDAACEPLRAEILGWLGRTLRSLGYELDRILILLDSRRPDARGVGLDWFRSAPEARDDVELWRRLAESPHDDVRLALADTLRPHAAGAGGEAGTAWLRGLWASVLLNVRRGSWAKPGVIEQVARRLERHPGEAPQLVPLLAIALRSLRRPERHAALGALVRLADSSAAAGAVVRASFPELKWE